MERALYCLVSLSTIAVTIDRENHNKYSLTFKCDENERGFCNPQVFALSTVGSGAACMRRTLLLLCVFIIIFFY